MAKAVLRTWGTEISGCVFGGIAVGTWAIGRARLACGRVFLISSFILLSLVARTIEFGLS